jgi:hypothetical protein
VLRALERVARASRPARARGAGAPPEPLAPPRGRLVTAMGVFLAVALVTMLAFEHPLTRVVGVLCIFGFIVSGVFAVADPRFLAAGDDEG